MGKATRVANVILGGTGVVCLIVLVYLVYRYSWTQERAFASPAGMLLYYGVPAVAAGLCFAALRLPPSHRVNAALLLSSTAVSIGVVESLLNVWFSLPSVREAANRQAASALRADFDTRAKLEVMEDLRRKGIAAYATSSTWDLLERQDDGSLRSKLTVGSELLPLGWISNAVTLFCNESGEYELYDSDERGFHNPRGLWNGRRIDIVALGDSYVHGYCVASAKNFVALIRQRYPATLSLGFAGHGPLTMLATLKEYGTIVKPRVVLWFYFEGNDLRDGGRERNSPLLRRYVEDDFRQGLIGRQSDIDRALMSYIDTVRNTSLISRRLSEIGEVLSDTGGLPSRLEGILRLTQLRRQLGFVYGAAGAYRPNEESSSRYSEVEMDVLSASLLRAYETVSGWGGSLYFVYLPAWIRYGQRETASLRSRDRVLQTARTVGLPIIDVHEAFMAHNDPLSLFPFRVHNHYNEAGHHLVAEAVLRSVTLP